MRHAGRSPAGRACCSELGLVPSPEIDNDPAIRGDRLWLRGNFPSSLMAGSGRASLAQRNVLIRSFIDRAVPRESAPTFGRLWTMLAHSQATMVNASDLGRALEATSTQTVNRHIDRLVDLALVRRLPPYRADVGKRLVKTPKVYILDSGILHALLGLETMHELLGHL